MAVKKAVVISDTAGVDYEELQSGDTLEGLGTGSQLTMTNKQGSTVNICEVVYVSGNDQFKLARADSEDTVQAFGLVFDTTIANDASGNIETGGIMEATTAQWDAVTGQTGGLTAGSLYYVDPDTAGNLTTTPPQGAGDVPVQVGIAKSTTQMKIQIRERAQRLLTQDETIYVSTSGDDANDGTSTANAFLTLKRAFDEFQLWVPGAFDINIEIAAGTYAPTATLNFRYPYGGALKWSGAAATNYTSLTCQNFDVAVSTDANFPELEYFDFEIVLSSGSVAVGDYIMITTTSGGSNNQAIWGLHQVQAWDGTDTATLRVWRMNGVSELPSGAITANCASVTTIIEPTGDHFVQTDGPFSCGQWNNMVIEGDQDAYDTHNAFRIQRQGHVTLSNRLGVAGWFHGLNAFNAGLIEASACWISKIKFDGAHAQNDGIADVRFGTRINGCGRAAVYALTGGRAYFRDGFCQGCGELAAIFATDLSTIDAKSAQIYFDDAASTAALYAENGSFINATSVTVGGWATTKSPAANPGNNEANIIGP